MTDTTELAPLPNEAELVEIVKLRLANLELTDGAYGITGPYIEDIDCEATAIINALRPFLTDGKTTKENEQLKRVISWANNSLFGSHGFFLSTKGGEPDEHILDTAIEVIKKQTRDDYAKSKIDGKRIAELEAALQEIADFPANEHTTVAAIPLMGMVVTARQALKQEGE